MTTISELILKLEQLKKIHGNVPVYVPGGEDYSYSLPVGDVDFYEEEKAGYAGIVHIPKFPARVEICEED